MKKTVTYFPRVYMPCAGNGMLGYRLSVECAHGKTTVGAFYRVDLSF